MAPPPKERLDSWKEIAAHLQKDERTVQRWEKENGLPVHRIPGKGRQAVFAYRAEIDAWLAGANQVEPSSASPAAAPPGLLARIPRLVQAGLLAGLAIGLYAAAASVWKASTSAPLASVRLRDNKFEARDSQGRLLWTYELPQDTAAKVLADRPPEVNYVSDFGAGNKVVLVGLPSPTTHQGDSVVYCFSERGNLLWRFQPTDKLAFGAGDYGPPWVMHNSLLLHGSGGTKIALAADQSTWWPSVLTVLDGQGQPVGKFVNSGQTFALASVDTALGPRLLAGGVRNQETEVSGRLAVLDADHPSGSSPEAPGSDFECKSCPPGRPIKYFVFPRSELNVVTLATFNQVRDIRNLGEMVEVRTSEATDHALGADGIFEFTPDFQLKSARWSDGYRQIHRLLESEGKIRHHWEQCPDRFGPRLIRSWDPQHGWTAVRPNARAK